MEVEKLHYMLFISSVLSPIFTNKLLYPGTFIATSEGVIEKNVDKIYNIYTEIIPGTLLYPLSINRNAACVLQTVFNVSKEFSIEKMQEIERNLLGSMDLSEGEVIDIPALSRALYAQLPFKMRMKIFKTRILE